MIFKSTASMMRHFGKTDGPYEEQYSCHDIHVKKSPHEIYLEYNQGYPDLGWFIPAGFFETLDEYRIRAKGINELVKDWTYLDFKKVFEEYWIPRCNFRSFQQWTANQMLPRMNYLAPHLIPTPEGKSKFMLSWLIDIGWDPNHSWICLPPEDPYDDVKYVTNKMWDMLNHRPYQYTKNEYCQLFHNNAHRYAQFVDMVDKTIPRNPDKMAEFMITREKIMISHLVWLAKTDVRVFDHFKQRIFKDINHEIAMSMAINDPMMREEDRVQRDLMLMTAPIPNEYLTRHEGHNKIRDCIVGEHVPSCDHDEVKFGLMNYYFRGNNPYMENYLMQRYAYFLDHPDQAEDTINRLAELPPSIAESIKEKYGKYDYEIIAAVSDAAYTSYTKTARHPRKSKMDVEKHVLGLLRELYPIVIRVQARLDPTGYEKVVHDSDMNIIGAIRVIMANDDAKQAYFEMARRFGSHDPRHNKKIVELMTEIATDTINQVQVQRKFDVKDPQHVLLRKETPRNPRNMVSNFFEWHCDSGNDICANDEYDVVSNCDDQDGHLLSSVYTPEDERKDIHDIEMDKTKRRNQIMRKYGVDRLGDALQRYMPDFEAHKMNYVGHKDRDIFKSNITERRRKLDDEERQELFEKYDLSPYLEDEDDTSIDLSDTDIDDIFGVVDECFTPAGKKYIRDLIFNFDLEAKSEYDEVNEDQMEKDRVEVIRSNVEEIIESGDPLYIEGGLGEKGSFIPEDVDMTGEKMIDMIEWMTTDELEEFINEYIDPSSKKIINEMLVRGYTEDDVRELLIKNADELAINYDESRDMEDEEDDEDEIDLEELSRQLEMIFDQMSKRELVAVISAMLENSDKKRFLQLIDAGMHVRDIRKRLHHLLMDEYEPMYIIEFFSDNDDAEEEEETDEDFIVPDRQRQRRPQRQKQPETNRRQVSKPTPQQKRESLNKDDLYDKFNSNIVKGASLYGFMQHFMKDSEFDAIIRTLSSAGGSLSDAKEVAWNMILKRASLKDINDAIEQFSDFEINHDEEDEDDDLTQRYSNLDEEDDYADDEYEEEEERQEYIEKLRQKIMSFDRDTLVDFVTECFDDRDVRYLMRFRNDQSFGRIVFKRLVERYDIDSIIENILEDDEYYDDYEDDDYDEYDDYYDDDDEEEDDGKFHFDWNKGNRNSYDDELGQALIQRIGSTNKNALADEKQTFYRWMIRNGITLDMQPSELKRMIDRMNSLDFKKFTLQIEKLMNKMDAPSRTSRPSRADVGNYGGIINRISKINVSSRDDEEEEETDEEAERNFRRALYGR